MIVDSEYPDVLPPHSRRLYGLAEGAADENVLMITEETARAFLFARFGTAVTNLALLPRQGEWSRAFRFDRAGRRYLLRFSQFREDFEKDRIAERYRTASLPVPAIVEIGESEHGVYAISEYLAGDHLDDLDEEGMNRVLPSLLAALDAAREAEVGWTSGYGGWTNNGRAPHSSWREALLDVAADRAGRIVTSSRQSLVESPMGSAPFDEAFARMRELIDHCPEARHLVHADLLNRNVLVAGDRISAFLDWGCSQYGDFLYDVAWLSMWWPWFPAWSRIDIAGEARRHYERCGVAVPVFAERIRCYELHIGLDGMLYAASRRDWEKLRQTTRRTLDLARQPVPA